MNILVTGGAGFIGSHVVDAYIKEGHNVVVIDNLSGGMHPIVNQHARFYHMDVQDNQVETIIKGECIDIINHHAAQTGIRHSTADSQHSLAANILEAARKCGVKKVIFPSSGGAIYGEQEYFPADEDHPLRPLTSYGMIKLSMERSLLHYKKVYGMDYIILRYANVYGPRQNSHGEGGVVAIFCHHLVNGMQPIIHGKGTQTRDYTFIKDVVRANILALDADASGIYNVGTGIETDVNTLFQILRMSLNPECHANHGPEKQSEPLRSVITYEKIQKELGWAPTVSLKVGLRQTAEYFKHEFKKAM